MNWDHDAIGAAIDRAERGYAKEVAMLEAELAALRADVERLLESRVASEALRALLLADAAPKAKRGKK